MKISIITVVYNKVRYVDDCIKSVISQSYPDIEYIVIDGKSTDGTMEVIGKYKEKIAKIVSEKDNGHVYAMNKGLRLATGDVIGFLHADDFYADKNVIRDVADRFKDPSLESVYGDLVYVDKENTAKVIRYWRSGEYNMERIKFGWMPPHPTFFARKNIYEKYGSFDASFKISIDYEILLRLLYKYKISSRHIPRVMVKMRWGGISNRSLNGIIIKSTEDYRIWKIYGGRGGIFVIMLKNISKLSQFFCKEKH
ncbi:MAG: glycosyltransferase [Candidatus Omnitrophica bacterium]|nr:glycosyltransferase [Candidatus Omnitrophota bacterium]